MINDPALLNLLSKINDEKGLDFSQYKEKSIIRRIQSRMSRNNAGSYGEYIKILDSNPQEYDELVNALTINVTEFFRNEESFTAIEKIVIPRVIYSKRVHHHKIIRVLSCGCSSGDEPYSLAILFMEKLGKAREKFMLNITGIDIDNEALAEAKNMVYSKSRLTAVSKRQLDEYFEKVSDDEYKLKSFVRDLVKFKNSSILTDSSLLHCDIILCRNLLIYFNKQLQEEVLLKLYESLNPGGFLVLGMVENLTGEAAKMFEHVNNRLRIYRRPDTDSVRSEGNGILSQNDIDKIVGEMLN